MMKPSDILKKTLDERVKKAFKESLNEDASGVSSTQELSGHLNSVYNAASEKMSEYTSGVLGIIKNASVRYKNAYDKFMETFGDYVTGEIKCDFEYGEASIYFSTSVRNSNEDWDDLHSPASQLNDMIDRFYDRKMGYQAEVAYESKETVVILLKIDLIPYHGLNKTYISLLHDIDPSLCDDFDPADYED